MKRGMVCVLVVVLALVFAGQGLAAEKKSAKKPDATLSLTEGQVALGIGWSWGKGALNYKGKKHSFKVEGLSVGDVGVVDVKAEGKVFHLKKLADFSGTYASATAEATLGPGAGATVMKNEKGVVIYLFPKTTGANLVLAGQGVKFTLQK